MKMISRRNLLYFFLVGGFALPRSFAHAEDGSESRDDDGGGGDGGGDDGGSDGGGWDNEGDNASGGDLNGSGEDDDQDQALDAVRNDDAASLKDILAVVRAKYEGEIVHVSLSGSVPNLIYHIKLLDKGDRLIEVQVDALSRQIVHIEGT